MRSALVAIAVLSLVGAGSAPGQQRVRNLNIYNWSDYMEPTVVEAFSKETGI